MHTPIITPKTSLWEGLASRCRSWTSQVKQGIITGAVTAAVAVAGWLLFPKSKPAPQMRGITMTATNVSGSVVFQGNGNSVNVDNSTHFGTTNVIPSPPQIIVETLPGLPVGSSNSAYLRMHHLSVRNTSLVEIANFCSRLQLPEPIIRTTATNQTIGTLTGWRPLLVDLLVDGTGGRSAGGLWIGPTSAVYFSYPDDCFIPDGNRGQKTEHSGAGDLTGVWELTFDKLPPGGHVSIQFLTSSAPEGINYIKFASVPLWQTPPNPEPNPDTNELRFFLEGQYEYRPPGKPGKQHFLVPIVFNAEQRKVSSLGTQSEIGRWHPVTLNLY